MTTPTPAPLGIGVFGLDDPARNILIPFFADPCKGCFALVDWADAEIRIVDLDGPDGADHFKEQAATNPKQPIIGISTHAEKSIKVPYFIKKPMRLDTVWSVLMQAGGKIRRPAAIAAEPQIPKPSRRKALPKTDSKVPPPAAGPVDSGKRARSFAEQCSTNTAATADAFEQDDFNQFLNRIPDVNLSRTEATPKLFYDPEG